LPGFHRPSGVLLTRKTGDEQGRNLIPNQFINESICLNEDIDCRFIETVHQAAELEGAHLLGYRGRAAHIHE
jgi:hypothetical protein